MNDAVQSPPAPAVHGDSAEGAASQLKLDFPLDPDFLTGMTPWGRERYHRRRMLVDLTQQGVAIADALRQVRLNITSRSAQLLLQRFAFEGELALLDGRSFSRVEGRNPRTARTPQVEALVGGLITKGVTGIRPIQRALSPVCSVLGLPAPSPSTIRRILAARSSATNPLPSHLHSQGVQCPQASLGQEWAA